MISKITTLFAFFCFALCTLSATVEEENSFEKKISFGNTSSNIHLYLFTDWLCGACQKSDSAVQAILKKHLSDTQITYVDIVSHPQSLPFIGFNLSFMLNNKSDYPKIRTSLMQFASDTPLPTSSKIEDFIKNEGFTYKKLDESTLAQGKKLFESLLTKYSVDRTPTLVVADTKTNQSKKLVGVKAITETSLNDAIKEVSVSASSAK